MVAAGYNLAAYDILRDFSCISMYYASALGK